MRNVVLHLAVVSATLLALCSAASAGPSPRQLVEMAEYSGLAASPDGRYVAFRVEKASIEANRYGSRWFVMLVDGSSPPWEVGDGGEPIRRSGWPLNERANWSQDQRWIYFRAVRGGAVQVWRAPLRGGEAIQVTDDAADVEAFTVVGDAVIYRVGATREAIAHAEDEEYFSGIRIDGTVPIGQNLFRSAYINGRLMTERYAGAWMDRMPLLSDSRRVIRVAAVGSSEVRAATAAEATLLASVWDVGRDLGDVVRSPSGDSASLVEGSGALVVQNDQGIRSVCGAPACRDPAWFGWIPGQRVLVFATTDRDAGRINELHQWNVARDTVHRVARADGRLNGGTESSRNNGCALTRRFAICAYEDANTPPELRRINLASGVETVVHQANPEVVVAQTIRVELLRWRDPTGRSYTGQFLPAARDARELTPLFINYYSCPGYVDGSGGEEWPLAAMAEAGIAALCINTTPNDDRSDEPGRSVADYDIALSGIRSAIDFLVKRGIDRTRVGVGGYSFGAEVATWVAMNSDLAAAVSLASPTLTETYYWQRALMGGDFRALLMRGWALGTPADTPEQWRRLSPTHNLNSIDAPILMQVPEQEYLVAVEHFAPMVLAGKPVEMYVFPHAPHYKFEPRHRLAAYERNLDWFRFWLQNHEDASPAKAEQYARWRDLRAKRQAPAAVAPANVVK